MAQKRGVFKVSEFPRCFPVKEWIKLRDRAFLIACEVDAYVREKND